LIEIKGFANLALVVRQAVPIPLLYFGKNLLSRRIAYEGPLA
jgi:hypothetical protein